MASIHGAATALMLATCSTTMHHNPKKCRAFWCFDPGIHNLHQRCMGKGLSQRISLWTPKTKLLHRCWRLLESWQPPDRMISWNERFNMFFSVLLLRSVIFLGSIIGFCFGSFFLQAKIRAHIDNKILPALASVAAKQFGREVRLGNVEKLSPMGITLGPCSVGTHRREFSCAELPKVDIRLRPFRSIKRGTIVVDVILSHPHILVCQKRDWSWLGIPNPSEKQHVLQSTDHNIDTRTKIRRVSRESYAAKFAEKRDAAAKLYSHTGYDSSHPDPRFRSTNLQEEVGKLDIQMDERNKVREGELLSDLDTISSNSNSYLEATGTGPEMKLDTAKAKFHNRSIRKTLLEAKRWLTRRAHKYRMFAVWNNKDPPAAKKEMYQRRNLDRAAVAAAASFVHEENGVNATDGFKSQDIEYDLTKPQEKNDKVTCPPLIKHKLHELKSLAANKAAISAAAGQAEDYKQYLAITHQAIISSSNAVPHVSTYQGTHGYQETGSTIREQIKEAERMAEHVKARAESGILEKKFPISLESVHFTCGTLTLLAYGDHEPRMLEEVDGWLKFEKTYENINVQVTGKTHGITEKEISHGIVAVKAVVDIGQQKWHVKLKVQNLSAPLFNRLLEIPLDCSIGQADGEVHIWMEKSDHFPNFGGKIDLKDLQFQIWEAPSAFKNVHGTLFFQGQRIFLHNTKGFYGYIPVNVSGDMDLNPENGEYRLSCQVPEAEVNSMMESLNIRPPPFSVAGNLKAVVYCRGPLDRPIFEGSVETPRCPYKLFPRCGYSPAYIGLESNYGKGAVAAYDRIAFSYVSANFTFDTDNCVANLYGIRINPVSGGEIRGAGEMWVCPEGEMDPTAVRVDCSGHVYLETILQDYVSATLELPAVFLGAVHGEAKIRGSLLQPIFDIGWAMPEAKGTFDGAHGDIRVSYNAMLINAAASTFDLAIKVETAYPAAKDQTGTSANHSPFPKFGGLDVDVRLRGFDIMGFVFPDSVSEVLHAKLTGKLKFQGRVTEPLTDQVKDMETTQHGNNESMKYGTPTICGEVQLSGIKLNQLFIAHQFAGSLELSQSIFKIHTAGRLDDHLIAQFSTEHIQVPIKDRLKGRLDVSGLYVSLQRGQLLMDLEYVPQSSAILQIRNLLIDELELASLRGFLQKVDIRLNLQKRRGSGNLSLRRPRFSGVHGESLEISARWSGDVITLEKSILEQSSSRYELQGEYVFPGPRDWVSMSTEKGTSHEGMWMAGELGRIITSLGRWRLRLEVPRAQVAEMLPLARLLSRSSDPAVVSRSKALFLQGVEKAAFISDNLYKQIEFMEMSNHKDVPGENLLDSPLPGLAELNGHWHATIDASGGGNSDTRADFDLHGEDWEWGAYRTQKVVAVGGYCNSDGFRLEKFFIQKDTATLHADGTLLGPTSNLHFAVLNFPVGLVPRLLHAFQESSLQRHPSSTIPSHIPVNGILHMEGDLRGNVENPQCEVQVRLLDGIIRGVNLGRAEMAASITAENQFFFNAVLEPVTQAGHVYVKGNIPLGHSETEKVTEMKQDGYPKEPSQANAYKDDSLKRDKQDLDLRDAFKEWEVMDAGELSIDAAVKDGGMMLLAAVTPDLDWIQGNADIKLQVRGTKLLPKADGTAVFHKVAISSPVLPRPISNLGGRVIIKENELFVEEVEGRVGRRGNLQLKGSLAILPSEKASSESIEIKAETLVVRAKNTFSGQVDCHMRIMHSLLEPEVTGIIKLSHGEAYLSQEKGPNIQMPSIPASAGRYSRIISNRGSVSNQRSGVINLPGKTMKKGMSEDGLFNDEPMSLPLSIRLKALKVYLGPELRVVYPLILNFAVNGELELSGFADPARIRPKGTLTFENGDVNLVATQVRLNKDYLNRARFEPEQGLDPTLDLALVGADWQLKVQGRARQWQDNLVMTSTRSGGQDAHAQFEAARVFESQLAESLLEGDGQIAFKKLAAATVETLMPKIETKGEFGQARWRLVYAPQIPNLLSIDPTTDPFKSLANLSFGTEVEVQLGKHLQASVVRQLRESEMATQWTLIYQLNNKLRILFSSIPSIDNRLLFEYSATS